MNALQLSDSSSSVSVERLGDLLCEYASQFCMRPGFFIDFVYFADLLERYALGERVLATLKQAHDSQRPFVDVKSIYTCLSYWQLHSFVGKQTALSDDELAALVRTLEVMYDEALPFGKDLLATGFQYADEFMIMAIHARYALLRVRTRTDLAGGDSLVSLIATLKRALANSPSNYQLKLLMLNMYAHVGAYEPARRMYDSMDIKNIQNYSSAQLLITHDMRLGAFRASANTLQAMSHFFATNLFDMANFMVNCYKYGTFLKTVEIYAFLEAMRRSLTLNLCLVNAMCIQFVLHPQAPPIGDSPATIATTTATTTTTSSTSGETTSLDFDEALLSVPWFADLRELRSRLDVQLKEMASVSSVFANDDDDAAAAAASDELVDHTDRDVLYHWDTRDEQRAALEQYELLVGEQRRLFRLRSLWVRLVDACLSACLNSTATSASSSGQSLVKLRDQLVAFKYANETEMQVTDDASYDAKLKIYVSKSFYLRRWPQLGLDKLSTVLVRLVVDLYSSSETFVQNEQANGQTALRAYRDQLALSLATFKQSLSATLDAVLGSSENKKLSRVEDVARVLECFSASLEAASFATVALMLCLANKQLRAAWSDKFPNKQRASAGSASKKKKTTAPSASIAVADALQMFVQMHQIVCDLVAFAHGQLETRVCADIATLGGERMRESGVGGGEVASTIGEICSAHAKSCEEMRKLLASKLAFLLKMSNTSVQAVAQAVANLQLN